MRKIVLCAICVACLFVSGGSSLAADDGLVLIAEGKYFSVYGDSNLDISSFLNTLNFNYYLRFENYIKKRDRELKEILGQNMDAIFLEIEDILGVKLPNYHGEIRIFANQRALNVAFKRIYGTTSPECGFFVQEHNAIYFSNENLTLGIIGHEMAHALISQYFVVPPPPKIQEVLSGYVEFKLRKSTDDL